MINHLHTQHQAPVPAHCSRRSGRKNFTNPKHYFGKKSRMIKGKFARKSRRDTKQLTLYYTQLVLITTPFKLIYTLNFCYKINITRLVSICINLQFDWFALRMDRLLCERPAADWAPGRSAAPSAPLRPKQQNYIYLFSTSTKSSFRIRRSRPPPPLDDYTLFTEHWNKRIIYYFIRSPIIDTVFAFMQYSVPTQLYLSLSHA